MFASASVARARTSGPSAVSREALGNTTSTPGRTCAASGAVSGAVSAAAAQASRTRRVRWFTLRTGAPVE